MSFSPMVQAKSGEPSGAQRHFVQPKLEISKPGDAYEQEANEMAEKVAGMPSPKTSLKPLAGIIGPSLKNNKKPIQAGIDGKKKGISRKPESAASHGVEASPGMVSALNASKGGGVALPKDTRSFMESAFSADFSAVRIHTDGKATAMSNAINARAFTHGNDIYFKEGNFAPNTFAGKKLLAHELTHVVQHQRQSGALDLLLRQNDVAAVPVTKAKPSILEADDDQLKAAKSDKGYFTKNNNKISVYLTNFEAKEYLVDDDLKWLDSKNLKLPKAGAKRKTKQGEKWAKEVKKDVLNRLTALSRGDNTTDYSLTLKADKKNRANEKRGIYGKLDQLTNDTSIPFWNLKGTNNIFDVEHKIDWQLAGGDTASLNVDNIENLILLDRSYNRQLGNKIRKAILDHLDIIRVNYSAKFTGMPHDNVEFLTKYTGENTDIFIGAPIITSHGERKTLGKEQRYLRSEMNSDNSENPFNEKLIEVKEARIPDNHFVLRTTKNKSGYFIPYQSTDLVIGSWRINSKLNKDKKGFDKLYFEIVVADKKGIIVSKRNVDKSKNADQGENRAQNDQTRENIQVKMVSTDIYEVEDAELKKVFNRDFKELYSNVKQLSPIVLNEPSIDGFDAGATGKVLPTLSLLKDVNVDFGIDNSDFFIKADIPLEQLTTNFPKPFTISNCNLIIEASSDEGLEVNGNVGFKLGNFGTGELIAGVGKSGVFFKGAFNFNNKWFNPAVIEVAYLNDAWTMSGEIGLQDVTGIKKADLFVSYKENIFSIDGSADLTVPGVNHIEFHAEVDERGDFELLAATSLGKLPGISGGNVSVQIKSKPGEDDIKLKAEGDATPDLKNVPGLNANLHFLYDNGIFDLSTKVLYEKGKLKGEILVGVTNKEVDEHGQPKEVDANAAAADMPVVIYGFGKLTVELFEGGLGMVEVRLTPQGAVLVSGEILLQDLSPFGKGTQFKEPIATFPKLVFPLVGVPGLNLSATIGGGVFFEFDWQPLLLKQLKVDLEETDINHIDTAKLDISGVVGSTAKAEVYLVITAGLKAQATVLSLNGELGGEAGLGIEAEAGGAVSAIWNMDKGLQFKEIRAFLNVSPKAIFKLIGQLSIDLDLWVTTINLYQHTWILAEKSLDLSGLALKLDFPILFDDNNRLILPEFSKINLEKPDFTGDSGKQILDEALNGDAKKEEAAKEQGLRNKIKYDLRNATKDGDFTPSKYVEKLKEKYEKTPELQKFVVQTIAEESKNLEYERFEQKKMEIRSTNVPLENKLVMIDVYTIFNAYISKTDIASFKAELTQIEKAKRLAVEAVEKLKAEQEKMIKDAVNLKAKAEEADKKSKKDSQKPLKGLKKKK